MNNQRPLSVLFLTYSAVADEPGKTAFLGVLKRCLRLIAKLHGDAVHCRLLNCGALPYDDPLVRAVLPMIDYRTARADDRPHVVLQDMQPDVVVLGEGPGNGMMLELSKAALAAGIPQVCIENYYGPGQPQHYKKENPWIDRWLLLGLPFDNDYGRITPNAALVPPLLPTSGNGTAETDPVDITILGYDGTVARLGMALLRKLPPSTSARLVYSDAVRHCLPDLSAAVGPLNVEYTELPGEHRLQRFLSTSRIVVCKSGFQQMVESLAAGTPAVVYDAPGGVPELLLAGPMRPFIQYFPPKNASWSRLLMRSAFWLSHTPSMPWRATIDSIADPVSYAAGHLHGLLREVVAVRIPPSV